MASNRAERRQNHCTKVRHHGDGTVASVAVDEHFVIGPVVEEPALDTIPGYDEENADAMRGRKKVDRSRQLSRRRGERHL